MDALQEYFGVEAFDFEGNKRKLIDNLNLLKAMSVEEQDDSSYFWSYNDI